MDSIKYYFASLKNFDNQILYPRVPKSKYNSEDGKTKRICVSQSIDGCLTAVGKFAIGDIVFIHECESNSVIQPTLNQVEDRCFTGEQWILDPVQIKLFMKVEITERINYKLNNLENTTYAYEIYD